MDNDTPLRINLAPLYILGGAVAVFYAVIAIVRVEIGRWPSGNRDWVPLDTGNHGLLTGAVGVSALAVGAALLLLLVWVGTVIARFAVKRFPHPAEARALVATLALASAFLLCGGFRFLMWALD